jgi:hypothetical protein
MYGLFKKQNCGKSIVQYLDDVSITMTSNKFMIFVKSLFW